jgi:hypothetical protein
VAGAQRGGGVDQRIANAGGQTVEQHQQRGDGRDRGAKEQGPAPVFEQTVQGDA